MEAALDILFLVALPFVVGVVIWLICRIWMWERRLNREAQRADFPEQRICRGCGYDLRASDDRCPECGERVLTEAERALERGDQLDPRALRDDWPVDSVAPRTPEPGELSVIVHETFNQFEAELLVQQLRARGIAATIQQKDEFSIQGAVSSRVANLLVVVPSNDESMAGEIVDHFRLVPKCAAKEVWGMNSAIKPDREKYLTALRKAPDGEPDPHDRLE